MTEDEGPRGLSFQPKLFTGTARTKTVAIAELYKQLKKLSKELNALEQETVETQSLDTVTKELLAPALLRHKEAGVVAYVSCCIADILRLYAPEAPYSDKEIKTIFSVFVDQLSHLSDSGNQFYPLREYLLTSLATVRTPALVAMLPDAEDVITRFFTVLFGVVSSNQPHNIHMQILDILQLLIEEPKAVPQDVIDIILLQFTKKRQQDSPAAHQLASDLANGTADILQKYFYQYFSDIIVSAAQLHADNQEAEDQEQRGDRADPQSSALRDLRSAHALVVELVKAAPATLLNVIPQLEEELGVGNLGVRLVALNALGEMFAEKGFTLAKRYGSSWKAWKGRRADTAPAARIAWIKNAMQLYQRQPQLARELNDMVAEKLCDVDEKVRENTCRFIGQLEFTPSVQSAVSAGVIVALGERCKDRKLAVRAEAIVSLATIYNQVYSELEQENMDAVGKFGNIPSVIMSLRFIKEADIDTKIDSVFSSALLNFAHIKASRQRCERLLFVVDGLSAKARTGLLSYLYRQRSLVELTTMYLSLCERSSSTEPSSDLAIRPVIARIVENFPDKAKMESALVQLSQLGCSDVYSGLRETMNTANDFKAVRRHQKNSLRKISTVAPNILDPTAPLWKAVGLTAFNCSLTPFLVEYASSGAGRRTSAAASPADPTRLKAAANVLVGYLTDTFPSLLKVENPFEVFTADMLSSGDAQAVEERLDLLAKFVKSNPASVVMNADVLKALLKIVRKGTLKQGSTATYILTHMPGAMDSCMPLITEMANDLAANTAKPKLQYVAALSNFLVCHPSSPSVDTDLDTILRPMIDIATDRNTAGDGASKDRGDSQDESEWVPYSQLGEAGLTKVYAIIAISSWLRRIPQEKVSKGSVGEVLSILRTLIENRGTVRSDLFVDPADRNHILLTAARCCLELAEAPHLDRYISHSHLLSLLLVVQDPCYEVRSAFLLKHLIPLLVAGRIHPQYLPAIFLVAHDPEAELRSNVKHAVELRLSTIRRAPGTPSIAESSFPRLLHLLTHHPDWDDSAPVETLELFAPYIEFYISCACSAQNVSLLFYYAGALKGYRNRPATRNRPDESAEKPFTRRLYVISELAQYLIREKSISSSWPVNVYPAEIALPNDIFEPLTDAEKAGLSRDPYLDAGFVSRRAKASAAKTGSSRRTRPAAGAEESPSKRRRSSDAKPGPPTPSKGRQSRLGTYFGSSKSKGKERAAGVLDDDSDEE
ncbi:Sister chromatid cohesion protein pds5 [Dipsacomyces acuminosporus]|nr:Sister chromatid cohesion protein pds5 [Dipsacomyces acuminosporus]